MKKWKLVNSKDIYSSKWITLQDNTYKLPNGETKSGYLHLKRGDYVLIFAINEKKEVLVEKQYRRGLDVFNFELPAGWVDKNEKVTETAKRELLEETGYECTPQGFFEIYPQPAFMEMKAYVVFCKLGKNTNKVKLEEDENIKYELIHLELLVEKVRLGEIKDMGLISSLGLYFSKKW